MKVDGQCLIQTLRSSRPLDKRGGGGVVYPKNFFGPSGLSLVQKIMEGGSGPRVPPLNPPLPGLMFMVSGGNPLPFLLSDSIFTAEGLGYYSEVVK